MHRHKGLGSREPLAANLLTLASRLVLAHGSGSRNSGSIIDHVLRERPRPQGLRTVSAMNDVSAAMACGLTDRDYELVADGMNESAALLRELHADIADGDFHRLLHELGVVAGKPCGAGVTARRSANTDSIHLS